MKLYLNIEVEKNMMNTERLVVRNRFFFILFLIMTKWYDSSGYCFLYPCNFYNHLLFWSWFSHCDPYWCWWTKSINTKLKWRLKFSFSKSIDFLKNSDRWAYIQTSWSVFFSFIVTSARKKSRAGFQRHVIYLRCTW